MPNTLNARIRNFDDGEVVSLEWTTPEGEEVVGVFGLVGWIQAPLVKQHDVVKRQEAGRRAFGKKIIHPGFDPGPSRTR